MYHVFFNTRLQYSLLPMVGRMIEHYGVSPKGGDLCEQRLKPSESLVEGRRGTDVQIVRHMFV